MYSILLVDDETPALRFLQAIIQKYAEDFSVAESCQSGEAAVAFLRERAVDLLLTDISMPGMDGIALALEARALHPDIHIVIVSGYADFEYAKGAIQAAVDDYILKPVSVTHIKEILSKIKGKLDEESAQKTPPLLSALFSGGDYDKALLHRLYGDEKYYFALARWGNLGFSQGDLRVTSVLPLPEARFSSLYGRDEDEQLLFASAAKLSSVDFQSAVKAYVAQRKNAATSTIVFARGGAPFASFPNFFARADLAMNQAVVIGRRQFVFLTDVSQGDATRYIPNNVIKRLEYFIQEPNLKMVKDTFITLAADWEKRQLPQRYAATMVQQLTHLVLTARPVPGPQQDVMMREADELLRYAVSYGELMAGLYATLFDDNLVQDRKLTAEDLYNFSIRYIQEKYAQPINIQSVCAEIGISQTYLSRLFRKHGNTTFIAYLTQCRMNGAQTLIREHPEISLREVARCVGYDDYAYFNKVFHQFVGCSPSQWAASAR